jgi:ribulose-phosphate 3-epimerase
MNMVCIVPSILSAKFTRLGEEVKAVEKAGADWIHVDVMDGHFVPNLTIGPDVVRALREETSLPLDVHLMIDDPDLFIPKFIEAGAHSITFHWEVAKDPWETIRVIRGGGAKASIAFNPETPLSGILPLLPDLDMVLPMTVHPGFPSQKILEEVFPNIRTLRKIIDESDLRTLIEADGGIKVSNIATVSHMGVDVFVAGSEIFGSDDYTEIILRLRQRAVEGKGQTAAGIH